MTAAARRLLVLLLWCAACGIDARGSKIDDPIVTVPPASTALPDAGADISVEASTDASIDVVEEDATPTSPLCPTDTSLIACFGFEGTTNDGSPTPLVPLMAENVGYATGREGKGAVFTLAPKTDLRLPPDEMNTTAMTIEMWIKPASLPASGSRYILVDQNGRFGVILQDDGTMSCRSVDATTKATVGVWHHLACVHDGTTLTAYVDGKNEASEANTLGTTSDFVGIGEDSTSTGDAFVGMMDNLRIWTRALTPAEVLSAASR